MSTFGRVSVLVLLGALAGCGDGKDSTATIPSPAGPSAVTSPAVPYVRIASLSADLAGAEVLLDGSVFRTTIGYPRVTRYRRIEPGSHRIRFVPSDDVEIDERTVTLDTGFDLGMADAVTIVAAGLADTRTLRVVAFRDDLTTSPGSARIRLVNAMSDFPAPLDLWLNESEPLVRRVTFLEEPVYRVAAPGNHPLELRRNGTPDELLPVIPRPLAGDATYTLFAFGTLRQGDLDALLVLDASQGSATLKR